MWDGFPVTEWHALVLPRRHVLTVFDLTAEEFYSCSAMIGDVRDRILEMDPSVSAFNIGTNAGVDAGQSILHAHLHVIPRRAGDTENPRGGIRHVIPGKGNY